MIEAWQPAFSPDGSMLAYMGFTDSETTFDVFVADADGTGHRRLTDYAGWDGYPVWSPDGSELWFLRDHESAYDLAVVPVDGGEARVVVETPDDEGVPLWAGGRLVVTRTPIGNHFVSVDVGALLDGATAVADRNE